MGLFDFLKPKTCDVCSNELAFKVIIGYDINSDGFEPRTKKYYCLEHGLVEIKRLVDSYKKKIVFEYPLQKVTSKASGSFFCTTQDLLVEGYLGCNKKDVVKVEDILNKISSPSQNPIAWVSITKEHEFQSNALHFTSISLVDTIDSNAFIQRLEKIIKELKTNSPKGEYWFTEPRRESGIYLFDDEI